MAEEKQKNRTITIDDARRAKAKSIGFTLSHGIRIALDAYKGPQDFKTDDVDKDKPPRK